MPRVHLTFTDHEFARLERLRAIQGDSKNAAFVKRLLRLSLDRLEPSLTIDAADSIHANTLGGIRGGSNG